MLKKVKVSKSFLENNGFEEIIDIKNKYETHMLRRSDEKYATVLPNGDIKFMGSDSIFLYEQAKKGKLKV